MTQPRTIDEAIAQTKADPNRSMREDQLVAEIEWLRRFVQFVANCSNDPGVVREAERHGAV